jgi:hypothetical protein
MERHEEPVTADKDCQVSAAFSDIVDLKSPDGNSTLRLVAVHPDWAPAVGAAGRVRLGAKDARFWPAEPGDQVAFADAALEPRRHRQGVRPRFDDAGLSLFARHLDRPDSGQ